MMEKCKASSIVIIKGEKGCVGSTKIQWGTFVTAPNVVVILGAAAARSDSSRNYRK